MMILQDNMENKFTNIRALVQERIKALKDNKQAVMASDKKAIVVPQRMKEIMEKVKLARESKGITTTPPSFSLKNKLIERSEQLKNIINKKQPKKIDNHE